MTIYELQQLLPPFYFGILIFYIFLFLLRIKKLLKLPLILLVITFVLIPGSFLILPVLAFAELVFQTVFIYKLVKN